MRALRIAVGSALVIFSLLMLTAPSLFADTGCCGGGGDGPGGAGATGAAGGAAAAGGAIALLPGRKPGEDDGVTPTDDLKQACRESLTYLNGLSAQVAEAFRAAGSDAGLRAAATTRLLEYRNAYNDWLGQCAEQIPQRPSVDPGMTFSPTDDSWSHPTGPATKLAGDTPERKEVPGACRILYDDYKVAEGRVNALENITSGLREKLGDAERIHAENGAKARIMLGYEFGPQIAESGEQLVDGLTKLATLARKRRLTGAGFSADAAQAIQRAIDDAEAAVRQLDGSLATLGREVADLESALPDLQVAATAARKNADELASTIGPLEQTLDDARRKLNGLPDRPTAVSHFEDAGKRIQDLEEAKRLRDAAQDASDAEFDAMDVFKSKREEFDRAAKAAYREAEPYRLADAADGKVTRLKEELEGANLRVSEAKSDLRGSASPADGNTGAVARLPDANRTGANQPPVNRTQQNPVGQRAVADAEAELNRIRAELAQAEIDLRDNLALCNPTREMEIDRLKGVERRARSDFEESYEKLDYARELSKEADAAYHPVSGKIGRKEDVSQRLSDIRMEQARAGNVIDDIDETIGVINEVGPKVDQMKKARVDAQAADQAVGKQAQKVSDKRKEQLDVQNQRDKAQEKANEAKTQKISTDEEDWSLVNEFFSMDLALTKRFLRWLGHYAGSGQSWEDVIRILEQDKKNIATLTTQLEESDKELDEARKKLVDVRGDLTNCTRDNGGTWTDDGSVTLTQVAGPGLGGDTDSRLQGPRVTQ